MVGRLIDRIAYMSFDRIVCISEGVREALVESYPSIKSRSEVIYNGVDIPRHADAIPAQVESEKGSTIVMSVGILARRKNIDTALNALAWLEGGQWEYWIVGDGPIRGKLEKLARVLGIRDRVRFWGYREDVPRLLKAADIFLLPSKWEGFGLAVVEAMAAGLPVIVGDVAGVREVVNAGKDGLLVDPASVVDVAKKLSILLKEPAARKKYSARASSAAQRFRIEQTAEEYMSLYKRVVDNKKQ